MILNPSRPLSTHPSRLWVQWLLMPHIGWQSLLGKWHRHILSIYSRRMLQVWGKGSVWVTFNFLSVFSHRAICRKIQQALSHSPVMHGRQEIRMPTLLSQATGMKKSCQITGRIIVHSLASHRWILLMMEFALGVLYSELSEGLG